MPTPKLEAIIEAKCPRCRRGKVFSGPMYRTGLQQADEICSHCNLKFEIEPGYFYVAMYISYVFNVVQIIITGILTYYLSNGSESPWLYIGVIIAAIIVLAPFNFRYSRVILLHYLSPKVKYNPDYDND